MAHSSNVATVCQPTCNLPSCAIKYCENDCGGGAKGIILCVLFGKEEKKMQ